MNVEPTTPNTSKEIETPTIPSLGISSLEYMLEIGLLAGFRNSLADPSVMAGIDRQRASCASLAARFDAALAKAAALHRLEDQYGEGAALDLEDDFVKKLINHGRIAERKVLAAKRRSGMEC